MDLEPHPSRHHRRPGARYWALVGSGILSSAFIVQGFLGFRRLYLHRCGYMSPSQLMALLGSLVFFTALLTVTVYTGALLRYRRKHGGALPEALDG